MKDIAAAVAACRVVDQLAVCRRVRLRRAHRSTSTRLSCHSAQLHSSGNSAITTHPTG